MNAINLSRKQKLVLEVIKENPEAANNDAILLGACWRKEGWNDRLSLEDNLKRVSRPETLSRRRREIAVMGLIKYSEPVLEMRQQAFINERDAHSEIKWWRES